MGLTLGALLALALLAVLTGRLVARLLRIAWLDRMHPDVLPLQAAIGTAAITLAAATASHLGLGQRWALVWLIGALVASGVACRRVRGSHSSSVRVAHWLPLLVAMVAALVVALLPLVRLNAFNPFNDTCYYNAVSDWLMNHGVDERVPRDALRPVQALAALVEQTRIRLGTSYLQALITAASGVPQAIRLFPVVSGWGFVLLAGCLYSLGRRGLRMPPWLCTAAVCSAVCVPAGASHALQAGFQAQLYGTSALAALTAVMAGLVPRRRWTGGGCVLAATLLAWQTSVYSELLPVAMLVLLAWVPATVRSARRRAAWHVWCRMPLMTILAWLCLANFEALRASSAIPLQMTTVVGWHIDLHEATWLGLLTGGSILPEPHAVAPSANPMMLLGAPLVPLGLGLLVLLFGRARHLLHGPRVAIGVMALLAAWFAFVARDPWTGDHPHTWSLLKVIEWLHPFVLLAAWGGAALVLRRRLARAAAALVGIAALLWGLPLHVAYARENSCEDLAEFTLSDRPFDELTRLSNGMAALHDETLYIVTRPEYTQPRFVELLACLAPRSRVAGRWAGSHYLDGLPGLEAEATDRLPQPGPVTLIAYRPHVPVPGARTLGAGVVAVSAGDDPLLVQIGGERLLDTAPPNKPGLRIGTAPLVLVVFAPRAGWLRIDALAERCGPATGARHVEYGMTTGTTRYETLGFGAHARSLPLRLNVQVEPGVNEISVRCRSPAAEADDGSPSREALLTCSVPTLAWADDVAN